jgi:hypothetical protein
LTPDLQTLADYITDTFGVQPATIMPPAVLTAVLRFMDWLTSMTDWGEASRRASRLARARWELLIKTYGPFTTLAPRFDTTNTRSLYDRVVPEQKPLFPFSPADLDVFTYWPDHLEAISPTIREIQARKKSKVDRKLRKASGHRN